MNKTAGIKPPSNLDDKLLGELKQLVLLFDLIGIPQLNKLIETFKTHHKPSCSHYYLLDELDYLQQQGLLFTTMDKSGIVLKNDCDIPSIGKEFKELSDIITNGSDYELALEAGARLSCLMLNNEAVTRDFYSLPLIKRLKLPTADPINQTDVINLIVERMPIPDNKTPWENIIEFKTNPDNVGRFFGLRNWVNKAVRSGLSVAEIHDELEFLLYQYQKSLELHKIKHQSGILHTIVVGTAEMVENVLKLKFSNIAKGLFSAQQSKADLLLAELTAPGNELAYIYKAREEFVR